ncbi:MAG TPA: hypothetical protein PKJ83_09440 [Cyclobacteriaceae bacterium]|nr:hypothetical protein [Cyclobacteriaceae bacterium]
MNRAHLYQRNPADPEISSEQIATTITKEFDKLVLLYRHMKDHV